MKSLTILLLIITSPFSGYSQDTTSIVIIERASDRPEKILSILTFQDSLVCDTLQGLIKMSVTFDKNLNEETVNAICVELYHLRLTGRSIKIDYWKYGSYGNKKKMNTKEKAIYMKYCEVFKDLYMKQPYNDLKGREYEAVYRMVFSCKFLIVPCSQALDIKH